MFSASLVSQTYRYPLFHLFDRNNLLLKLRKKRGKKTESANKKHLIEKWGRHIAPSLRAINEHLRNIMDKFYHLTHNFRLKIIHKWTFETFDHYPSKGFLLKRIQKQGDKNCNTKFSMKYYVFVRLQSVHFKYTRIWLELLGINTFYSNKEFIVVPHNNASPCS